MRRLAALVSTLAILACDAGAPGSFPPEDPALAAQNQGAGDPYAGRFPFEAALAGLPETGTLRATIVSDAGEIHCELLADLTPLAVASFIGLARGLRPFLDAKTGEWTTRPFYDGLVFHRAEPRAFVQGGRLGDEPLAGFRLQDERSIGTLFAVPGVLALANEGAPNSSSAQFFITTEIDHSLDGHYTILGFCDDLLVVRELERRVLAGERPVIETVRISRE